MAKNQSSNVHFIYLKYLSINLWFFSLIIKLCVKKWKINKISIYCFSSIDWYLYKENF